MWDKLDFTFEGSRRDIKKRRAGGVGEKHGSMALSSSLPLDFVYFPQDSLAQ